MESHLFVKFDGDNFEEVLKIIPGYIRCRQRKLELHIFIPFRGDTLIKDTCVIFKFGNDIRISNG